MAYTNCRRKDMMLVAHMHCIRNMLRDPEASYFFERREEYGYRERVIGRMFGVRIAVAPEDVRPRLEARL
jgi:hypothetical protein